MTNLSALVAEQQTYYSLRAAVHEGEASDYMAPVIERVVDHMRMSRLNGHVLELACGTGHLTQHLSGIAHQVDAMDGSAEMLDALAMRNLPNVSLIQQDIFTWHPTERWDAIFFANWISHVPPVLLSDFWKALDSALHPGGRVIFVDATPVEVKKEIQVGEACGMPVAFRAVNGQTFRVIKRFWDPGALLALLEGWGWTGTATPLGDDIDRGIVFYDVGRINA